MKSFKHELVEARKARVPLARVGAEMKRADRRIRSKALATAASLLILLTLGGVAAAYYQPWNALIAAALPESATDRLPAAAADPRGDAVASIDRPAPADGPVEDPDKPGEAVAAPAPQAQSKPLAEPPAETAEAPPPAPAVDAPMISQPPVQEPIRDVVIARAETPPPIEAAAVAVQLEDDFCRKELPEIARQSIVRFPLSGVAVSAEYSGPLRRFAEAVARCPDIRVDVGGHTDKTGEQLLNLQLSWQRAENVIKFLSGMGFDVSRFSPVGFSATRPLAADRPGEQGFNRRVEFIIR